MVGFAPLGKESFCYETHCLKIMFDPFETLVLHGNPGICSKWGNIRCYSRSCESIRTFSSE